MLSLLQEEIVVAMSGARHVGGDGKGKTTLHSCDSDCIMGVGSIESRLGVVLVGAAVGLVDTSFCRENEGAFNDATCCVERVGKVKVERLRGLLMIHMMLF